MMKKQVTDWRESDLIEGVTIVALITGLTTLLIWLH